MLGATERADGGAVGGADGRGVSRPPSAWCPTGLVRWSGGGFVGDDSVGERGDEGLEGEVVDHSGVAAAGLVDQGGGVVGERGCRCAGEGAVVAW